MREYENGREIELKEIYRGSYNLFADFIGSTITGTIFFELEESFKLGHDVAVIALAQVLLEEELVRLLISNNINPTRNFSQNIELAKRNDLIGQQLKDSLNASRENRNKILHPNLIKDSRELRNLAKDSLNAVTQFLKATP